MVSIINNSKCWKRAAFFILGWMLSATLIYVLNDPRHNDEGSFGGAYLSALLLPVGLILWALIQEKIIKKPIQPIVVFAGGISLQVGLLYASIFLISR